MLDRRRARGNEDLHPGQRGVCGRDVDADVNDRSVDRTQMGAEICINETRRGAWATTNLFPILVKTTNWFPMTVKTSLALGALPTDESSAGRAAGGRAVADASTGRLSHARTGRLSLLGWVVSRM
ncbi:hypothetical protein EV714DRAFT_276470 [Schizophyllum commune]